MNESMAIVSFLGLVLAVLVAARLGQASLRLLAAVYILLSNITVGMPVPVFGVEISWAIVIYSLVYFITDIVSEHYGRRSAYQLALTNLLVQVLLWLYVWSSLLVEPSPDGQTAHETMRLLFGTSSRITVAALVAGIGPFLDIATFALIRDRWDQWVARLDRVSGMARVARNRVVAIVARNKLSTFAGQILNTIVFFSIAFVDTGVSARTLLSIIVSASLVKVVVALADIPFLVLVDRFIRPRGVPERPRTSEATAR